MDDKEAPDWLDDIEVAKLSGDSSRRDPTIPDATRDWGGEDCRVTLSILMAAITASEKGSERDSGGSDILSIGMAEPLSRAL